MKHIVDPKTLPDRAAKVGTSIGELSEDAHLARSTGFRAVEGNPTLETIEKLTAALVAREVALRDYLIALHPLETPAAGAMT
jgi:hypothetical protein